MDKAALGLWLQLQVKIEAMTIQNKITDADKKLKVEIWLKKLIKLARILEMRIIVGDKVLKFAWNQI